MRHVFSLRKLYKMFTHAAFLAPFAARKIFSPQGAQGGRIAKYAKAGYTNAFTHAAFFAPFAKNLCALCGEKNLRSGVK
ncbi:MAG: hypothetical protein LBH84_06765 [Prevotellaceae bacterium]|jgi:hypothetical protein|nr:hypothetical protein [Prevotellaceae bacterium]